MSDKYKPLLHLLFSMFLAAPLCLPPSQVQARRSSKRAKYKKSKRYRRRVQRRRRSKPVAPAPKTPTQPIQPPNPLDAMRKRVLLIATKPSPPFSMKDPSGKWSGLSIELWKEIASHLKLKYKFVELPLRKMLQATKEKRVDAAVASLTITPERERFLDFTHPFYSTGFGIAINAQKKGGGGGGMFIIRKFFTWEYMGFFTVLFALLLLFGMLVWLFERKANPEEFGGSIPHGIGAGFWWSVVTMTTVGYGDKSPRTFAGRLLAIIWIFVGLILVSSFTATLTTLLTVSKLESSIKGPQDLYKLKVATVEKSTSMRYLQHRKISTIAFSSVREGMHAVANNQADAMVYDAPILRYIANNELKGAVYVIPGVFEPQAYGIGLPEGSPLREPANRVLLRFTHSQRWKRLISRYLGK